MPAVPAIITAGAAITNAAIGAHSNNSSAKTQASAVNHSADVQAKATADALAAQKEEQAYERQQTAAQQAARRPGVDLSNSALGSLASILHVQAPNFSATSMPAPTASNSTAPTAAMPSQSLPSVDSLASLYQPQSGTAPTAMTSPAQNNGQIAPSAGGVKMIAPTGETALVAPADVARAVAAGAKVA